MKNIFIASFLILSSFLTAQNNSNYDVRLLELFSENEISNIMEEDPYRIQLIEYCLDHAFYFVETSKSKDFSERISGTVEIDDVENFNFFKLEIEMLENDYQYFKVKDKELLLVVKSGQHISSEINK
ncbi:MAG: hypothetical protein P8M12_05375 [Flavobacteriales bacterium]|nr:hypothetical protein [Flavobacteriales bacterium]